MRTRPLVATFVLLVFAVAPLALAQKANNPKKGGKPDASASAASASASASASAAPGKKKKKGTDAAAGASASASAAPAPTPEPTPQPEASASAGPPSTEAAGGESATASESTNVAEDMGKRYYFVGLRYRGTIIPQFIENLFVNDGATVYSNNFGAELDMRKDNQSTIFSLWYSGYGTGDILFWEKNKPDDAQDRSVVHSNLWALYLGLDELWSIPIDETHHWQFEYGFGVGIGVVVGDLLNNWVYQDPNGKLVANNGVHYSECQNTGQGTGCALADHMNATIPKVGGYKEKNWFNGGAVPVIFPHIAFPQFSLRYKPIKQFEARVSLGFSITGFWFGISGDYGLEKPEEKAGNKAERVRTQRDML